MKSFLVSLCSLAVVFAAQLLSAIDNGKAGETGAIEGTVVSATTGLPLRKAAITIHSDGKNPVSAITDDEGKFVLENLDSGDYSIKAKRVGYLDSDHAPVIQVSAGQRVADFVLKLTPQGIVAGSVVDQDGDPVPDTIVTIKRFIGLGQKHAVDLDSWNADGEGEFKFTGLKPGRYYLLAQPQITTRTEQAAIETWYPDAIDPTGALPITVTTGGEIRDIEIRLRKARVFSISGKVTGVPKGVTFMLSLTQNDRSLRGSPVRDGGFVFLNVLPGSYVIKTSPQMILETSGNSYTWSPPALFCDYPVEVGDKNVERLSVPLTPAGDLAGQFKIDSSMPKTPPHVVLHGTLPLSAPRWPDAQAGEDGSFRIAAVPPDEYEPHVRDLPEGMYVKSMRYDGQAVTHGRIDLNSLTRGELEITLSPTGAAAVKGTLTDDAKGDRIDEETVVIWSENSSEQTRTAKGGAFEFHNLAPGDYFVAAADDDSDLLLDSEYRAKIEGKATKVSLQENSSETIEVKLIEKSAVEAALAQ